MTLTSESENRSLSRRHLSYEVVSAALVPQSDTNADELTTVPSGAVQRTWTKRNEESVAAPLVVTPLAILFAKGSSALLIAYTGLLELSMPAGSFLLGSIVVSLPGAAVLWIPGSGCVPDGCAS